MKVTKKELDLIIENYLLNERFRRTGDYEVKIPQCNFNFDSRFLKVYEIIMNKGERSSSYRSASDGKPDWLNPAFIEAFKSSALPFINLLVAPQFGIETYCNIMIRLNRMFNDIYDDYSSGLSVAEPTSPGDDNNDNNSFKRNYDKYVKDIDNNISVAGINLTPERAAGSYLTRPRVGTLEKREIRLAQFLLGNLDRAMTSSNQTYISRIIQKFKYNDMNSLNDLFDAAKEGKNIEGWDDNRIRDMLAEAIDLWPYSEATGVENVRKIYLNIFKKLKAEGIIS